jgi:hypothetical protein
VLDPTTLTRRLLDRGKATTGLSYDQILKSLSVNAAYEKRKVRWAQSYEYFDGLDDPYRTMDFYVDGVMQHATTASVLRINEAEQLAAVRDGNTLLADLRTRGLIVPNLDDNIVNRGYETYHLKYLENYGRSWVNDSRLAYTDVRMNDPARWLTEFPIKGDCWNGNLSDALTNLPIPKKVTDPVYLGPQFWNTNRDGGYATNQMMDDITEALAIIVRLHKSANCNMAMSPALNFGMRGSDFSSVIPNPPSRSSYDGLYFRQHKVANIIQGSSSGTIIGGPRNGEFVYGSTIPPESLDFTILPYGYDPLLNASMNTRQRRIGSAGTSTIIDAYDIATDYAQIMNLLAYFISLPPHVLIHSCMYFHNYLFRTTYNFIGQPYGTSFANYRQLLAAEYAATAAATVSPLDLSTFGFSNTSNTLAASTVMSLPVAALAMSLGLVNPAVGIISGMLIAVSMMIADLAREPPPRDPRLVANDVLCDVKANGLNTNYWRNHNSQTVINSRPVIRYA